MFPLHAILVHGPCMRGVLTLSGPRFFRYRKARGMGVTSGGILYGLSWFWVVFGLPRMDKFFFKYSRPPPFLFEKKISLHFWGVFGKITKMDFYGLGGKIGIQKRT